MSDAHASWAVYIREPDGTIVMVDIVRERREITGRALLARYKHLAMAYDVILNPAEKTT